VSSSNLNANPAYYHQFDLSLSYTVSDGSVPSSAPIFSAKVFGTITPTTLTTSVQKVWYDASSYSVSDPIPASPTTERWKINTAVQADSGTIASALTVNFLYYHQFSVTFGYTTSDLTTIKSISGLTNYTQFGTLLHLSTNSLGALPLSSDWADATTTVAFLSPVTITAGAVRYQILPSDVRTETVIGSVSATNKTANPEYFHQYLMTFEYTVSGGGSPAPPVVSYTSFGHSDFQAAATGPTSTAWVDATTTITYPATITDGTHTWTTTTTTFTASSSATLDPTYS